MAKVITMEEREAGKKKRGFAKFKEDVGKVSKKVGAGLKKGGEAAAGLAKTALRDPALRQFAKEAAIGGLHWLAGHPLADKLSYGKAKELKPWVGPIVEAADAYAGPNYFGPQTNFGFDGATRRHAPPPLPSPRKPPLILTKSPASLKRPRADRASDELYV